MEALCSWTVFAWPARLASTVRRSGSLAVSSSRLRAAKTGGRRGASRLLKHRTTGSIKAAEAQDDAPASPAPHADAQVSPSDAASPPAAPNASASETASAPDA